MNIWQFLFLLFIVITFIILLVIIFVETRDDTEASVPLSPPDFEVDTTWSTPVLSSNSRSNCNVYTFSTNMIGKDIVYFGPTLDADVLDALTPEPVSGCVYPYQITAAQYERTCQATQCFGFNGQVFQNGEKETIYLSCDQTECDGVTSLVQIGFNPCKDEADICFADVSGIGDPSANAFATTCNALQIANQLHQIMRVDNNGDVSPTGNIAKIVNISTGRCLYVNPTLNVMQYEDCDAPNNGLETIVLPNGGFGWTLLPSIKMDFSDSEIITPQTMHFGSFDGTLADSPRTVVDIENYYNTNATNSNFSIPKYDPSQPNNLTLINLSNPIDIQNIDTLNELNMQFLDFRTYNSIRSKLTYPDPDLFGCTESIASIPFFVPAGSSSN